jgi:hypothetical protein
MLYVRVRRFAMGNGLWNAVNAAGNCTINTRWVSAAGPAALQCRLVFDVGSVGDDGAAGVPLQRCRRSNFGAAKL